MCPVAGWSCGSSPLTQSPRSSDSCPASSQGLLPGLPPEGAVLSGLSSLPAGAALCSREGLPRERTPCCPPVFPREFRCFYGLRLISKKLLSWPMNALVFLSFSFLPPLKSHRRRARSTSRAKVRSSKYIWGENSYLLETGTGAFVNACEAERPEQQLTGRTRFIFSH